MQKEQLWLNCRMLWILLPQNRSQNNIFFFCSRIINRSFNVLAYTTREHFTHCWRNKDISEYSYQKNNFFSSGIINLLFDGLAYNTSGHFVCSCIARIFPRARNFKSAWCYAADYWFEITLPITPWKLLHSVLLPLPILMTFPLLMLWFC